MTRPITAIAGNRRFAPRTLTGPPTPADHGMPAMPAGHGARTNPLAGRVIISAVGPNAATAAGSGFPAINGPPPGSAGVKTTPTSDGASCRRKPDIHVT